MIKWLKRCFVKKSVETAQKFGKEDMAVGGDDDFQTFISRLVNGLLTGMIVQSLNFMQRLSELRK